MLAWCGGVVVAGEYCWEAGEGLGAGFEPEVDRRATRGPTHHQSTRLTFVFVSHKNMVGCVAMDERSTFIPNRKPRTVGRRSPPMEAEALLREIAHHDSSTSLEMFAKY